MQVSMTVNGRSVSGDVEPRTLLVHFLREDLRLTALMSDVKPAITVLAPSTVDGKPIKSCTMLAVQADSSTITTIEGIASNGDLHPVQEGFWDCRDPPLFHRRRLWEPDQSNDRGRTSAWWRDSRHRPSTARSCRLRRRRQSVDRLVVGLPNTDSR